MDFGVFIAFFSNSKRRPQWSLALHPRKPLRRAWQQDQAKHNTLLMRLTLLPDSTLESTYMPLKCGWPIGVRQDVTLIIFLGKQPYYQALDLLRIIFSAPKINLNHLRLLSKTATFHHI
jgi:hypothetical protein